MRWVRRAVLFVLAVGIMTIAQILIVLMQNSSLSDRQKQQLILSQNLYESRLATNNPAPRYDCDKEYQTLLGMPDDLAQSCPPGSRCSQFTCKAFLFNNRTQAETSLIHSADSFMRRHPKKPLKNSYFSDIARNCTEFKATRGYHLEDLSTEEANFSIAFNLLVHTDTEQVEKLLRAIYRPANVYCIHVDANSDITMQKALQNIASCFDNVFIASKLEHVVYAGFTRLQADINCMQDLVSSKVPWKYLMNIAGQSFPLMTNHELVKLFTIYNGMNDIEGMKRRVLHGRIDNEWAELKNKTVKKTGRKNPKPPHDIDIVRGSAYGIFSRGFVEFILTDEKAKDLLSWSQKTYSPDEHYWATLHHTYSNPHLHTPGGYAGYPDTKPWLAVFAKWGGRDKCFGKWKRGVCVLGVGDLPDLLSEKAAFVNKFYLDYQPLGLDCLDRWIEYKSRCPLPFNYDYYKNLAFIKSKWKLW